MNASDSVVITVAHFARDLHSISQARRFTEQNLEGSPIDLRDNAVLAVSELASNAVRHAESSFDLRIDASVEQVRVEVIDQSKDLPRPTHPAPGDPSGRGLMIVDTISDEWGFERHGDGKSVWAVLTSARGR